MNSLKIIKNKSRLNNKRSSLKDLKYIAKPKGILANKNVKNYLIPQSSKIHQNGSKKLFFFFKKLHNHSN